MVEDEAVEDEQGQSEEETCYDAEDLHFKGEAAGVVD
jgi:hypothetical protein